MALRNPHQREPQNSGRLLFTDLHSTLGVESMLAGWDVLAQWNVLVSWIMKYTHKFIQPSLNFFWLLGFAE